MTPHIYFFHILLVLLIVTSVSHAEIYKWVDENGTIHFSDKPYSEDAKEIEINPTGIKLHQKRQEPSDKTVYDNKSTETQTIKQKSRPSPAADTISSSDYKIFATVGKLRDDTIEISGRISKGPACDKLEVIATAVNENGLRASINQEVKMSTSWGSTTFSGKQVVSGSSNDRGFWEVDNISVRCRDVAKEDTEDKSPYRFTTSIGKIGADIIKVSGRVKSGPKCDRLQITAQASSDTELSATVTDIVRKPNSYGSVVFEGNAKVDKSSEDTGFWNIDSIEAVCLDQK